MDSAPPLAIPACDAVLRRTSVGHRLLALAGIAAVQVALDVMQMSYRYSTQRISPGRFASDCGFAGAVAAAWAFWAAVPHLRRAHSAAADALSLGLLCMAVAMGRLYEPAFACCSLFAGVSAWLGGRSESNLRWGMVPLSAVLVCQAAHGMGICTLPAVTHFVCMLLWLVAWMVSVSASSTLPGVRIGAAAFALLPAGMAMGAPPSFAVGKPLPVPFQAEWSFLFSGIPRWEFWRWVWPRTTSSELAGIAASRDAFQAMLNACAGHPFAAMIPAGTLMFFLAVCGRRRWLLLPSAACIAIGACQPTLGESPPPLGGVSATMFVLVIAVGAIAIRAVGTTSPRTRVQAVLAALFLPPAMVAGAAFLLVHHHLSPRDRSGWFDKRLAAIRAVARPDGARFAPSQARPNDVLRRYRRYLWAQSSLAARRIPSLVAGVSASPEPVFSQSQDWLGLVLLRNYLSLKPRFDPDNPELIGAVREARQLNRGLRVTVPFLMKGTNADSPYKEASRILAEFAKAAIWSNDPNALTECETAAGEFLSMLQELDAFATSTHSQFAAGRWPLRLIAEQSAYAPAPISAACTEQAICTLWGIRAALFGFEKGRLPRDHAELLERFPIAPGDAIINGGVRRDIAPRLRVECPDGMTIAVHWSLLPGDTVGGNAEWIFHVPADWRSE